MIIYCPFIGLNHEATVVIVDDLDSVTMTTASGVILDMQGFEYE